MKNGKELLDEFKRKITYNKDFEWCEFIGIRQRGDGEEELFYIAGARNEDGELGEGSGGEGDPYGIVYTLSNWMYNGSCYITKFDVLNEFRFTIEYDESKDGKTNITMELIDEIYDSTRFWDDENEEIIKKRAN